MLRNKWQNKNTAKNPVVGKTDGVTVGVFKAHRFMKFFNSKHKRLLIVACAIVATAIVAAVWWMVSQLGEGDSSTTATACINIQSDKTITDNAAVIANIQAVKGYDKDQNCLYVMTRRYINMSDPVNAKLYLNKLKARYDSKQGFKPELGVSSLGIQGLEQEVEFLGKLPAQAEENFKKASGIR